MIKSFLFNKIQTKFLPLHTVRNFSVFVLVLNISITFLISGCITPHYVSNDNYCEIKELIANIHPCGGEIPHKPKAIAHRGLTAGKSYPENMIPAFKAACESDFWGIEYDVRQTADKKLVICHNPSIKTSNGVKVIHEQTLEQLLKSYGEKKTDVRIPQFIEVFNLCLASGKMQIIEIKDGAETEKGKDKYGTHLAAGMEACKGVVSKIKEVHAEQTTRIASFSIPILLHVKNAYDGIHTHLFIGERNYKNYIENGKVKVRKGSDEEACLDAVQSVGVKLKYLTNKSVVDDFHKLGLSVDAWGITTEEEYEKAKALGVDSVTVEDAAILR